MNLSMLNAKIDQSSVSKTYIAEALGLTRMGLLNKLKGDREFKSSEIRIISDILKLTPSERDAIFFADYVDKTSTNS